VLFQATILLSLAALSSLTNGYIHKHDETIRHVPLEPFHVIRRRSLGQPLQISLDFLDIIKLEDPNTVKDILEEARDYFSKTLNVRKTVSKILLHRRCINKTFILKNVEGTGPGNVRFCQKACNITRLLCGPVEIPEHDLDQCRVCDENGDCRNDTSPEFTAGEGHNNTDFVLYVTAVSNGNCNNSKTLAYAAACQQESSLDRPVAGFINICPEKVTASELRTSYNEVLATIKHEIFHALAFSPSLYAFFRSKSGAPLTPRLKNGLPSYNSILKHYQWSEQTVKVVTRDDWLTRSGSVRHSVHLMVTPKVKEEVRRHFNCSTLEGAELENQGGEGTALAHWEKRLFENEGMTGIFTHNPAFSRLTLALMEDTGWYKVNYEMAEPLQWGKDLGCLFAENSCGAWIKAQKDAGKSIAPFCNIIKERSDRRTSCSVDRTSVAKCNLAKYEGSLPAEYQNFVTGSIPGVDGIEDQYGGTVALADYCPYYQGFTWTKQSKDIRSSSCTSHHNSLDQDKNYALETYGKTSACFEQTGRWKRTKCNVRWTASIWGSGCYRYACEWDSLKIIISGYKFKCFHEGQLINILVQEQGWEYEGVLVCPSCQDVCSNSGFTCPAEIKPAPKNSQPIPKISAVTCSQCSIHLALNSGYQILLIFVVFICQFA